MVSLFNVLVREENTYGIQIGGGILRIAHLRVKGRNKELTNIYNCDISKAADEEIAEKIRAFFTEEKVKNPSIILVLSSDLVITKNIEIPSRDPAEISDIMNLQASRHTPYGREEIIVDYVTIGVHRVNYTKILLVIATREIVRKHLEIVRKAGLAIDRVSFSSEAVGLFLSRIFKLYGSNFPVGIFYIDNNFSYFNIIFKGSSIFVRSIPIGDQHFQEDYTRYSNQFAEEIQKTIEVYKGEDIEGTPQRFILLDGSSHLRELTALLADTVGVAVETASFIDRLNVNKDFDGLSGIQYPSLLLETIASCYEKNSAKIDLVPEEVKLKKIFQERSRQLIWTGFFSLSIVVLVFVFMAAKAAFKSRFLDKLNSRSLSIQQDAEKLEDEFRRIQLVKNYLSLRGYPLEVLYRIYEVIPETVRLSEIRFNRRENSLSIKGTAVSMTIIYVFVDSLSSETYFKDVKTRYTTKRREGNKEIADFELAISLVKKQ